MGGHIFGDVVPVKKEYVPDIQAKLKNLLPYQLYLNIGSAGFKAEAGDMDVMLDAEEVRQALQKIDYKEARRALSQKLQDAGLYTKLSGRNVHVRFPVNNDFVQVDLMVVPDAALVAPYHQHGLHGNYTDPNFKGSDIFVLISSIAKAMKLKFDPFSAQLTNRETGVVVGRSKDYVAQILLNPKSNANDLNSVSDILAALANDPMRELKLAQAHSEGIV